LQLRRLGLGLLAEDLKLTMLQVGITLIALGLRVKWDL